MPKKFVDRVSAGVAGRHILYRCRGRIGRQENGLGGSPVD